MLMNKIKLYKRFEYNKNLNSIVHYKSTLFTDIKYKKKFINYREFGINLRLIK
jgi:hypothetical protein